MPINRARNLRKCQTDAERLLWQHLRARQMLGYKFRRQHPQGAYVLDFVCLENGLVIEVDGSQHQGQEDYDIRRTEYLASEGFRVLRFWNHEVLQDLEVVKELIFQALVALDSEPPSPRPSP